MTTQTSRPAPFFVADHRALDFLNTLIAPTGEPIEWLGTGADLLDWLVQADAIDGEVAQRFRARASAVDAVARQARALREWLREFVERYAGASLPREAVKQIKTLNALLAGDERYRQVEPGQDGLAFRWREERHWKSPEQLLQPIADAIGDLICHADFQYVRQCEGPTCTLMFYDISKSHARRWCSMAICGNRAKVAAHRARRRRVKTSKRRE